MKKKKKAIKPTQIAVVGDCDKLFRRRIITPPDLLICDSPYNLGMKYLNYDDSKPHDEFMDWMSHWLEGAYNALDDHGSLFIFAPDEWVAEVDMYCREELDLHRRSWIVWGFGFGVASQQNFARSHCHILYYTKHRTVFTFNADPIRVPSDRQLLYADKRANPAGKLPNNTWVLQKEEMERILPEDGTLWYESRICGTFKERKKHSPNQIPVAIMRRIVSACSNVGDLVLDPFCGTGSSGVVCATLNRNWIGWDISKTCVNESNRRITRSSIHEAEPS